MTISWSAEVRIARGPVAAFRKLAADSKSGAWVLVRRPLLLAFVLGCAVSVLASGRMSARLIADGSLSFAFVPVIELAAVAVVFATGQRPLPFARSVDLFFTGNAPWLLWLIALMTLGSLQTPRQTAALSIPPAAWIALGSLVPVVAWSAWIDFRFFREVLLETPRRAFRDVLLFRLIAWPCALFYFLGYAIGPEVRGAMS